MAWDILPKGNLQYFLQKLKGKLDLKVDAVSGKGLSTNDFTTEEKNKLAGIEAGAQVNPTIDSALSDSSVNAVQNKVVKAALDGKADSEEVPTVNNNTITIQLNGVTVESFKLNQATDETINIQVTKSSVGLGNVPNVSMDDQTPTFTQASARANIASGEKLSVIFGKIMKWFADLKTVAFSGSYTDLSNTPSALPASDVYAWAKAATKPTYTASEVGALAVNGTAAKATADADGNTISTTYMKKGVDYVTAGKKSGTTLGTGVTAEGHNTVATASYAHAEGTGTEAAGIAAHSQGEVTSATGKGSHAEGFGAIAAGDYSHAEGLSTQAASSYQHVEGQYNAIDTNNVYAHIIGGGTFSSRKNIFTVDWNGDVCAGRSNGLTNDLKLPTGADVISYLNSNFYIKTVYVPSKTVTLETGGWYNTGLSRVETVVYAVAGKASNGTALIGIPTAVNNIWYIRFLTNAVAPAYASGTATVEYWRTAI